MKNENWQDSEKKYEILVDDMSPVTQAELRRSGVSFDQEDDDEWQDSQTENAASENAGGISIKRLLLSVVVLCMAGALGVAAGFGIGGIFKQKRTQKAAVSDSSQTSSQTSSENASQSPTEEETQTTTPETLKEERFDIKKSVSVRKVNFTVLDGVCDDEMLFFTVKIDCNSALIGKSSGKVTDPYIKLQILPDETNLDINSLQLLEREACSFTVRVGFRLPQALQKEQNVNVNIYGLSVSREKINPETGVADVVCKIRERQPSTVSFVYGGQKSDLARHFYNKGAISLNGSKQHMDVAYVSPWFCQFSLYAKTGEPGKELPDVRIFMKDGTEFTADHPASVGVQKSVSWDKNGTAMSKTTYLASFNESLDSVNVAYIQINGVKAQRTDLALNAKLPSLGAYGYDEAAAK